MEKIIFKNCIICKSKLNLNIPPEHIIPKYLGGRLRMTILCKICNHKISARLYSQLKFDAILRKSVNLLRNDLPKIYNSVENQQIYKTTSPVGTPLKAFRRKSKIEIIAQKKENWIVLPTEVATKYMESLLVRDFSKNTQEAKNLAEKVKLTPNNMLKKIIEGLSFVKWDGDKFQPDLTTNNTVKDSAVILIAFEYLSILLGKSIYNPIFNHVREKILNNIETEYIKVKFLTSNKPQPFHLIFPEFEDKLTRINIHLFEYFIAQIEFINIHLSKSPDFCYLEDLKNKKSFGALSVVEGKSNQWREFNF
ncbi:hypothetical protein C4559_00875 [Candidatus Microgenomates bacterium]|nr:MAG: hypothetical protein C4559_00875 [Candidatus Microgenomates bacterium]